MSKLLSLSALAAGAAALAVAIKKKNVDPKAVARKTINAVKLTVPVENTYDNGVALTPPMGWSSWNTFRNKISQELIYETGKALKDSGLADCGYTYLNIDDCWQSSMRDENGRLQGDFVTFPGGIKALAQRVNALGLKLGLYTSNGTLTCEDLPASLGCEAIDADTLAEWGIEYFKYDFCHNVPIPSRAPCIEKITVSREGEQKESTYGIDCAILTGDARVVEDMRMPGFRYIAGLGGNAGACEFTGVSVPEDGEYIVTLCIRKKSNSNKYAQLLVNGTDIYKTTVPPTRAPSVEGRHQIKVWLKSGSNSIKIYNPVASRQDSAAMQYTAMGKELMRATKEYAARNGTAEKPIVYSICEWGLHLPWKWGGQAGNLWRTTPDIKAIWGSIVAIYELNVMLYKYASPGHWNDPDMLEVGNGSLTYEENKSHFTLWCMMAAPLILGNDVRCFINKDGTVDSDNMTYKIVSDRDLIAIDQDRLGMQCRRIRTNGIEDVLIKPLESNEFAVCFFNKSNAPRYIECAMRDILLHPCISALPCEKYEAFDLWEKTSFSVEDSIGASVPGHGVKAFRIRSV